jgi:CheY-like chemotaxis protein
MPQALVLSVGSDAGVLDTREQILRSADYIVVSAMSVQEAVYLLQGGDFDVIVLCHTLPQKDCERLTAIVRASGSRIPILHVPEFASGEHDAIAGAAHGDDSVEFLKPLEDLLSADSQMQAVGVPAPDNSGQIASAKKEPGAISGSEVHEGTTHADHGAPSLGGRKMA